jgi:hypothetical protein
MVTIAKECGCRGAESKSLPDRVNREITTCMTPEINLASVPSDPKAALGYAELHALWKADEDAYNAGRRISDAEFLIWMGTVRLYLTGDEMALFDQSTQDDLTNEEFRAEKAAVLVKILWTRHGLHVAKVNGGLRPAS